MIPLSRPSIGSEELEAVGAVMKTGWLGMGQATYAFERELREYLGAKHIVAVNSGTSALHLALDGFDVGAGDEVIVPSLTFAACVQVITALGAKPVFCEVNEDDLLMDIEDVKRRITSKTKAIMPVHYGGKPCNMNALLKLAERHHLTIIEDAAHAFGSAYQGRKIGSFGHAACFSFDPIKVMTCGEGGAIALSDDQIAEKIRRKRVLGIDKDTWHRYQEEKSWFYEITTQGYRYHMSDINAAIGLTQLKKIEQFIGRRKAICNRYNTALDGLKGVHLFKIDDGVVPSAYVIRVPRRRDEMIEFLKTRGISSGVYYIANHTQPFFKQFAADALPRTTRLCQEILTLPIYSEMTDHEVRAVIDGVFSFPAFKMTAQV